MIAIIDYGMGNLRSAQKALQQVGLDAVVTNDKKVIVDARAIVLPGVGAFADAMEQLRQQQLHGLILKEYKKGKPLVGICLGMQLFFEYGLEGEPCRGLSLLSGDIVKIPPGNKVPHMGWNQLVIRGESPLLRNVEEGEFVYFVHSYYAAVKDTTVVKAVTDYGNPLPALVEGENLYGLQFHPEKSGATGLKILSNLRQVIV